MQAEQSDGTIPEEAAIRIGETIPHNERTPGAFAPTFGTKLLLFFFLFFSFAYFFQSGQQNEAAKIDQIRSMVEEGSVFIDHYFWNTADTVRVNGHVLPNKPPGLTFASIPIWAASGRFLDLFELDTQVRLNLQLYFTTLFTVGIASATLGVFLFSAACMLLQNQGLALLLTLAFSFGTIAFPFSTLYFNHQFSAAFAFGSFSILFLLRRRGTTGTHRQVPLRMLASGALVSVAVINEYPVAIAAFMIGLYGLWTIPRRRNILFYSAGLIAGCSLHLVYNHYAFGRLLYTSYSQYAEDEKPTFAEAKIGYQGIQPAALFAITFGAKRGLFSCNPWLILIFPALGLFWKRRDILPELATCFSIIALFFAFNAGFGVNIISWGGGTSTGPRYIEPMIPFAALAIAPLLTQRAFRYIFFALALVSVFFMLAATSTEPRVSYEFENPIQDLFLDSYLHSEFAQEWEGMFGGRLLTDNSIAFNFGKLGRLIPPLQLLPLLLFWEFGFSILAKRTALPHAAHPTIAAFLLILFALPFAFGDGAGTFSKEQRGLRSVRKDGLLDSDCKTEFLPPPGARAEPNAVDFARRWSNSDSVSEFTRYLSGSIIIPKTSFYSFAVSADDGACLFIDGRLVVDNGGFHSFRRQSGGLPLTKGPHRIQVKYWEKDGSGRFAAQWAPFGSGYRLLRRSMLHPHDPLPPNGPKPVE